MTSKINVPYTNFTPKNKSIKSELIKAFEKVLDSGKYIQGPEVKNFEIEFAAFNNTKFSTGIANGTCSLKITLDALKLPKDSEVITAPNSFIASASSISLAGLKPVFVDVSEDMNINVDLLENAITEKTKAIMPVHLTGRPAKMDQILSIAKKYDLHVLTESELNDFNGGWWIWAALEAAYDAITNPQDVSRGLKDGLKFLKVPNK